MFDWASQPFYTLCVTFIFGPYITGILAETYVSQGFSNAQADAGAQKIWSWTQTLIGLSIALSAPFLGAAADRSGNRIAWIFVFSGFYVLGTFGLWFAVPDASNTTLVLFSFGVAMIGAEFALIFTNAMLPDLAGKDKAGWLSGVGFSVGYLGGLIALIIMLLFFEDGSGKTLIGLQPIFGLDSEAREGTRAVGPFTALWYVVFMLPFFLFVREPQKKVHPITPALILADVRNLVKGVPQNPSLFAWLVASMFLRDALNALYAFGGVYARLVLDWQTMQIGVFGILGATTAVIATLFGGWLDHRYGPKPVITSCSIGLAIVVITLCGMSRDSLFGIAFTPESNTPDMLFYILGAAIGGLGGILQAAARTMMVRHADPERATEAFGLYALSGKATAFLAPALIGLFTWVTGSVQLGIMPVALLIVVGLYILRWVHPEGRS